MDGIKSTFARCKDAGRPALVSYTTAGFPSIEKTSDILLGLEAGGADIIELGMPFSDPIADGPTIQKANNIALDNGTSISSCLKIVKDARSRGLKAPILFMGYYNPILSYGEDRLLEDCKEAGVNGFILVDLPPEEAVKFRNNCTNHGLSYVPLIAPATSEKRMKLLCGIADSFIYVVSRMGVTGATGTMNAALPQLLEKVHRYSGNVPAAVGFGISTREHVQSVGNIAEGVVIGSQIINILSNASEGQEAAAVEKYISEVTGRTTGKFNQGNGVSREVGIVETMNEAREPSGDLKNVDAVIRGRPNVPGLADELEALSTNGLDADLASRIGEFGGQYVPESLMDCLSELERGFNEAKNDPKFWEEFRSYYPYIGRPGHLQFADRLTKHAGGAKIWLKREDLNHTGSHKINNALGQILLARRLGKTEIIAETGAGQHGVDCYSMRQIRDEVYDLYGRRGCPTTSSERFQNQAVGC